MTRYLISFDDGAMDFIPEEEMPDVADAAHAVIRDARTPGYGCSPGGVSPRRGERERGGHRWDGHRRPKSKAYIAGLTIIDVPSREEALQWATKIAVACRCAQGVASSCPTRPWAADRATRLRQRAYA